MSAVKKKTKAEKKEYAKQMNEVLGQRMMSSSTVNSYLINRLHQNTNLGKNDFGEDIELDLDATIDVIEKESEKVKNGDLSTLEDMLVCQSYSLQHLFMVMASKISCTTNADHLELFARIALKAQNQCRSTVATLSEMKNPKRATFINQLNKANQMQVNNSNDSEFKILKKKKISANELLEDNLNELLDIRETKETIGINQIVETVGEVNRCKDKGG